MAHRSRLAGFIIDCRTDDLDAAARFWSAALGATIDPEDASDGTAEYRNFNDTPAGLHIEVQKVEHPSRVHPTSRPTTWTPKPRGSSRSARRRSRSSSAGG